jgi:hypothetical protein
VLPVRPTSAAERNNVAQEELDAVGCRQNRPAIRQTVLEKDYAANGRLSIPCPQPVFADKAVRVSIRIERPETPQEDFSYSRIPRRRLTILELVVRDAASNQSPSRFGEF